MLGAFDVRAPLFRALRRDPTCHPSTVPRLDAFRRQSPTVVIGTRPLPGNRDIHDMVPARWLYNSSLTHLAPQHIRPTTLSQASESFNYDLFDDQNGAHTPWSDEGAAQLTGSRYAILFDARATYKNEPVEVRFICHFSAFSSATS